MSELNNDPVRWIDWRHLNLIARSIYVYIYTPSNIVQRYATQRNATYAAGLFYILFSFVGWRAGYTNNPTFAKLFTMGFPATFMIGVCESFVSPGDETPWHMVWRALWAMYCFKVRWVRSLFSFVSCPFVARGWHGLV